MRRTMIRHFLPIVFCLVPILAGALVVVSLPAQARDFYLGQFRKSPIDWLIIGSGLLLFIAQLCMCWRALQWRETSFEQSSEAWLTNLAQAAEWFPLLGLLGTVAGILQTFSSFGNIDAPTTGMIISSYAPAITATGSGLLMALLNILPTWIVLVGRQMILSLGGGESS